MLKISSGNSFILKLILVNNTFRQLDVTVDVVTNYQGACMVIATARNLDNVFDDSYSVGIQHPTWIVCTMQSCYVGNW